MPNVELNQYELKILEGIRGIVEEATKEARADLEAEKQKTVVNYKDLIDLSGYKRATLLKIIQGSHIQPIDRGGRGTLYFNKSDALSAIQAYKEEKNKSSKERGRKRKYQNQIEKLEKEIQVIS